jgi:hypothetical protein
MLRADHLASTTLWVSVELMTPRCRLRLQVYPTRTANSRAHARPKACMAARPSMMVRALREDRERK